MESILTEALLDILERPYDKKGYLILRNYLLKLDKKNEAAAIEYLISLKFANVDHSNSNSE